LSAKIEYEFDLTSKDSKLLLALREAKNIYRSKAVGEPPLMLGISVWAAVKNALGSLGTTGQPVDLRLPATGEEVLRCITERTTA